MISNAELMEKVDKEREYYKQTIMQKQREIVNFRQILKDNGLDNEGNKINPSNKSLEHMNSNYENINNMIEEENESFGNDNFREKETEVKASFPAKGRKDPDSGKLFNSNIIKRKSYRRQP